MKKFTKWIFEKTGKWLQKEIPSNKRYLSNFNRITHELRLADVLLIEGHHRISSIIRNVTSSPWTHAALYIGRLHDIENIDMREIVREKCQCAPTQQLLIESILGKGTLVSSLEKYRHAHLRILRPVGLSESDAQKVINFAITHLGAQYNIRQIFDLFRFLLPWGLLPRRWRSTLFEYNASKVIEDICSSVIAEAFESVNYPILPLVRKEKGKYEFIPRNPKLFTPSDFDYSPYFEIIKYPMFTLDKPAAYHKLPWNKDLMSNDQAGIVNLAEIKKLMPQPENKIENR